MALRPSSARQFGTYRVSELGSVLSAFFAVVVIVAGGSAVALLVWPSHSGTYFSWDLGTPPTAALIGGLYLASVVTFADAATRPRGQTRSLTFGVLGLALPTLALTFIHRDVFDWIRPQAIAWVVLFCSAPISILLDLRTPVEADGSPKASAGIRGVVVIAATAAAALAAGLWIPATQEWLASQSPIPLAGLTADYLGAWCSFVAVASGVAALRGRTSDVRTVAVLLISVSTGSTLAAIRTVDDLQTGSKFGALGLTVTALTAIGLLRSVRGSRPRDGSSRSRTAPPHTGSRPLVGVPDA